ncbi:MAG: GatB/YqeY domain-containing protein [archaeon]|nr:GatB/YqeY domain-containing protein [archaeon]
MVSKTELQDQLKAAMKEKDEVKTGALRMLLSSLSNKEKEKQFQAVKQNAEAGEVVLEEEEIQAVVATEVKKRKEAAEAFEKGGRAEAAAKEKEELEILQAFLPEQLSEEEIADIVKEAIAETSASSMQDMGKVMAAAMGKLKGQADGAVVQNIVKTQLG